MAVAPGFRSRITTGLLVAAAALPVPLATTTAAAADHRSAPFGRPPHLVQRHGLPDDYAADPPLAGSRAGEGRGHPGRRDLPGLPRPDADMDVPDLLGLRDSLAEIQEQMPRYPDEPSEYFPWLDRQPEPDPDPDSSPPSDDDATAPDTEPESPSDDTGSPEGTEPSAPAPSRAAPSPAPHSDVADRLGRRPYKPLHPPAKPDSQDRTPPDDADADAPAAPYAMDTPAAPVERVLPMGAGLALTGLGLAFLGLRLRRR